MKLALLLLAVACAPSASTAPETPRALCLAAVALHEQGRLAEAEALYRDLAAIGYRPAKLGLGGLLMERGELAEAKTCLEEVDSPLWLAACLRSMGDFEQAARVLAGVASDDPLVLYNLAAVLRDAGRSAEPLLWEVAARSHPDDELNAYTFSALAEEAEGKQGERHRKVALELRHAAESHASNPNRHAVVRASENHR